jgi:UDP-N-acetylmuramoyl-tripeptide--D-alanyl-D-alanine ligase
MRRALEVLAVGQAGRRVAVLGEMLELGDRTTALHEEVGRAVAAARVDLLIAIGGPAAEALARGAVSGGLANDHVRLFATSEAAAAAVASLIRSGDLILVKGSRGIRTDKVVEQLKAEYD